MTVVDFNALQAAQGPKVTLMPSTLVGPTVTGDDFSDFSVFASVYVSAEVGLVGARNQSPALTITVEHSDDGSSWSTAATLQFGRGGTQSSLVSSPKAHFRAVADGVASEWQVVAVTAAPTYLDPSGGGGSTPFAEILAASGDTGGNPITNGAGSSLTLDDATVSLETDLDIEVHTTLQDINVNADGGNINIRTDPDYGGAITIDAANSLSLTARSGFGVATLQGADGAHVDVASSESYAQIESAAAQVRLLANGSMWLSLSNAPIADGDLPGPGFFGFWLDDTNGAAKFVVKGKTADGTVVQGELALL